jgi:O-antigen/teichoic acid export membrane protein
MAGSNTSGDRTIHTGRNPFNKGASLILQEFEISSFGKKVKKAFLWLGTGTFLGQLISWISTLVVIRLLLPEHYGLMAMAMSFLAFLEMVCDFGIGASIIQAQELTKEKVSQIFGFVVITYSLAAGLSYSAAPLISLFYGEDRLTILIRVLSLNFLLILLYTIPQSILIRHMEFQKKTKVDVASQILSAMVMLILAVNSIGVWSLVFGMLVLHTSKALGYNLYLRGFVPPRFYFGDTKEMIKFGMTISVDRILYYLFNQSDKIIGGKFLGKVSLGFYSIALNLASIPLEKILPIVTQVTFTAYSRIQTDLDRIRRNLLKTIHIVSFFSFPIFFGLVAVAPEGIPLILGPKWGSIVIPFQIICLTLPLKAISPILPPAIFAINRPGVNVVNMLITSLLMGTAFFMGVRFGIMGLCLAWLFVYPLVFFITTLRSLRALGMKTSEFFTRVHKPFLYSGVMLITIIMLKKLPEVNAMPLLLIFSTIILGAAMYIALFCFFSRSDIRILMELLTNRTSE